jgi:hypothetical protein
MIVSACPPSIRAFKLMCGRAADRGRSAATDLLSVCRWRCLFCLFDRLIQEKKRCFASSMTEAPVCVRRAVHPAGVPPSTSASQGGRIGALIGQRGAGPRIFPLTATSQLVTLVYTRIGPIQRFFKKIDKKQTYRSFLDGLTVAWLQQIRPNLSAKLTFFVTCGRTPRARSAYKGSSQPHWSGVRPLNRPKKLSCSCRVSGPQPPLPMVRWSTWRTGVTSAAVPVMKISSAA